MEELWTLLIDREARPLRLTPAGELFRDHAVEVLGGINCMAEDTRRLGCTGQRTFRIGMEAFTLCGFPPRSLSQFLLRRGADRGDHIDRPGAPPPASIFRRGRDFAAWLGLTPRQHSSGGKERLGRISKMGERSLRRLLILGVSPAAKAAARDGSRVDPWLTQGSYRAPAAAA